MIKIIIKPTMQDDRFLTKERDENPICVVSASYKIVPCIQHADW